MRNNGLPALVVSLVLILAVTVPVVSHAVGSAAPSFSSMPASSVSLAATLTPLTADEVLPQMNFTVDILAFLTTILAFLTTILVLISGYTVYKSHHEAGEAKRVASDTLAEAKLYLLETQSIKGNLQTKYDEFLTQLDINKATFEKHLNKCKGDFEQQMASELELFRKQLYETRTINREKTRLMELLSENNPNPDKIFPLLTNILDYPDQRSIEIYERLLEVFSADAQIVTKVRSGLKTFREHHYGKPYSASN